MFLKEANIKNFRCLKDVTISFDKQTVLIGENNTGKSAILDAIRFALSRNQGKKIFDEYDYHMDQNISSPVDSEGISITLHFEEVVEDEWNGYIQNSFSEVIQYFDDKKASVIIRSTAKYDKVTSDYENKTVFLNSNYEELQPKVQNKINSFLKLVPVFYLQALRDIRDTFSSSSTLWGRFMKKATFPEESLNDIQERIIEVNKSIIDADENLSKLVDELENIQNVVKFEGNGLVSVDALPLKPWDLLSRSQVMLKNETSSLSLPLNRHGQGTQSVSTILLFKAYIELMLKKEEKREASAILTLEEPEAHLHPQAVRALEKSLRDIECQKIITSHSPYFIQNVDLRNIRFLQLKKGETVIKQIKTNLVFKPEAIPEQLNKVSDEFPKTIVIDNNKIIINDSLSGVIENSFKGCFKKIGIDVSDIVKSSKDIFNEHELNQLNIFIQKTRGEILFARKWLLYEGQTEDVLIPFCFNLMNKNLDENGISTIMYRSNGSAKAFVKLARYLSIDWYLLGDGDDQGKKTSEEIHDCGITDEEFKRRVIITKEKDLEHELAMDDTVLEDYEKIVNSEMNEGIASLKLKNKVEYRRSIAKLVQKDKVDSAYKLLKVWEDRGMSKENVPTIISDLVKMVL